MLIKAKPFRVVRSFTKLTQLLTITIGNYRILAQVQFYTHDEAIYTFFLLVWCENRQQCGED